MTTTTRLARTSADNAIATDGDTDAYSGDVHEHFYLDDAHDGAASVCPIESCWWND